jgi:hypothetical protein
MTLTRPILILIALIVASAIIAGTAYAESLDCTSPVLIISDGRVTTSSFPENTTLWFGIQTQIGHSYSVEFLPPADNYVGVAHVQISALTVFGPNDALQSCRGASTVPTIQTSSYAPALKKNAYGTGRRLSFTAQSSGLYLISVLNAAGAGGYAFRAVDTTLFNPRWSTWSGFDDQWGFMNLSDTDIMGIFSVYDLTGRKLAQVQFSIPGGGLVFRTSSPSDLNLPRNTSGYAIYSHNGPPNSIFPDSYMINSSATVVVPTKFEASTAH